MGEWRDREEGLYYCFDFSIGEWVTHKFDTYEEYSDWENGNQGHPKSLYLEKKKREKEEKSRDRKSRLSLRLAGKPYLWRVK
jgi:hypothetical protein